ncbi:periplasmic component of the Tol biopolymer transport system [Saccharomonospora glauca K62]|uniref:Periplasmic component of the Tol biopolymer transport system n=1 Tax=Saccharomonospora glauca K62 TaxID=928724 RepID=I1D2I0_9PSEU|nr:periplasmic component of the Tol biopolymer transport system [Saccharomonospora glauca K62]
MLIFGSSPGRVAILVLYRRIVSRRVTIKLVGPTAVGLAAVLTTGLAAVPHPRAAAETEVIPVTVTEGTNLTAAAAPDGSVVMDLQGLLFRVPEGGGKAERLTSVEDEAAMPDVGPDGRIAYQSYADGRFHIWITDADGGNPVQLTHGGFDDREPRWSPDGTTIAFSSDRGGTYDIWTVDVVTGELTRRTDDPGQEYTPTWHPDGRSLAYVGDEGIAEVAADGTTRTLVPAPDGEVILHAPSWSPDGERLAYVRQEGTRADLVVDDRAVTDDEDVFLFAAEWLDDHRVLYTADGALRTRDLEAGTTRDVPFEATFELPRVDYRRKEHDFDDRSRHRVRGILTPALSPDARQVAFVALNDLWLMPIDGKPRRLTHDQFAESNPVFSPDGRYLAYAADRAGTPDLYVRDLRNGRERRVTALDGAEVSPAFSPDGRKLAFQDQDGATYVLDLRTGKVRQVVSSLFGPGRPSWSADGKTLAFAAVKPYSARFREGTSQILTVDVATGQLTYHAPGEDHASISTRGDDGPVWSPDGRSMAFVVDSTLRIMPVAADGTPRGPARELNGEIADAPSWSGDSTRLLYLSNGTLRLADVTTGKARDIDVPLYYRPDVARGRTVIHAGAFWDGESRGLRHDVDIVVRDNRIESVTPHRESTHHRGRFVDASDLTVMPGLMDSHVHQEYESRFYGDRQGRISLAYGITSTLSVGDQVYRALEDRESLDSGARVGPRFYATGEPIDGSRVYYNFMRPTTSDEQVEWELSRAKALDYDMIKTYVRLPADRMRTVIDTAHELGVPSASHYLSPGAHLGQDGTTHLAATQRLGYARTLTATATTYGDVVALYGKGERSVTATLFTTEFLGAEEIGSDPRLALYPSWTREKLLDETRDNTAPPSDPNCEGADCREVQALRAIADAGGRVVAGTDAPLTYVGIGVHANLRELVGYGWTPYDALRTATVNAAENLGVAEDVGTLEPGKLADLLLVRGDPLRDIDAAMRVEATMVGGHLYTRDELLAPYTRDHGVTTASATVGEDAAPAPATVVSEWADPEAGSRYWWHAPEVVAADYAHSCSAYDHLGRSHVHP